MDRPSPASRKHHTNILLLSIICSLHFTVTAAIQCYSCKAQGSNEIDANIRCLENAYLENCDEFYQYYNDVENQDLPVYDYYYYDEVEVSATGKRGSGKGKGGRGKGGGSKERGGAKDRGVTEGRSKSGGRESSSKKSGSRDPDAVSYREPSSARGGDRGKDKDKDKDTPSTRISSRQKRKAKKEKEVEYEYEYYDDDEVANATTTPKPEKRKPEHFCYSQISKTGWEGYTVEKGCKKITYCKNAMAKKPEWMHPWNFCCDRSRCNVKLVKDKPQRVFGMGCRRTDDCIQGHTTRPVCPSFFKSCPRLSNSLVKMECRVKGRTMASVKNGAKYRYMFREKKCFCNKGYFPRGPICTNSSKAPPLTTSFMWILLSLGSALYTWRQ